MLGLSCIALFLSFVINQARSSEVLRLHRKFCSETLLDENGVVACMEKVRNVAKIRNRYNQVPHLTRHTTWESDKTQLNITNESQKVSHFPTGDHNQQ